MDISEEDEVKIDAIHKGPGMHRTAWGDLIGTGNSVFGWTFEQLGWPFEEGKFGIIS